MEPLDELTRELNAAGFRGDELVAAILDSYEGREEDFTLTALHRTPDDRGLVLDLKIRFMPGGELVFKGIDACLLTDKLNQWIYPLAAEREIRQFFPGIPTVEEIDRALRGPVNTEEATIVNLKNHTMNLNNLENLKEEVKELRFNEKMLPEMEDKMRKGLPEFQLHDSRQGNKGNVDFTLHFKKSTQSDFFYLNKYDVYLNKAEPLAEGQKYMVLSKGDGDKATVKSFQNPHEAIDFFKGQQGNSELAMGKDFGSKTTLASMESGKVNFVAKDFQKTYYAPPITHTMYVEQGKGFTAEQSANLIEGRAVYRDDLINLAGQHYKAWVSFDFDKGKDRNDNFQTRQYNDPGYGFNLSETLKEFNIKELADPDKTAKLEESLRAGNRPLITTMLEGKEVKLHIEAAPRYGKLNFFQDNGKPEKREQFEVKAKVAQQPERTPAKELAQGRGARM